MRKIVIVAILTAIPQAIIAQTVSNSQDKKYVGEGKIADIFKVANTNSCLNGHNPFSQGTTDRIRRLAEDTMFKYIALAGQNPKADLTSLYTTKKKTFFYKKNQLRTKPIVLSWQNDGSVDNISSTSDFAATAALKAGANPQNVLELRDFLVDGIKFTAMGSWKIKSYPSGKTIGIYRARFMRENTLGGQAWKLMTLEIFSDPSAPAVVSQYCAEPGDVERSREERQRPK